MVRYLDLNSDLCGESRFFDALIETRIYLVKISGSTLDGNPHLSGEGFWFDSLMETLSYLVRVAGSIP